MLEVSHIGDVADITHLVSEMTQIAEKDVEGYRRARMAQMGVAIDGRPAHVHAYVSLLNRMERTARTCQSVVQRKIILLDHVSCCLFSRRGERFRQTEPRTS